MTLVRTRGGVHLRAADGARTLVLPVERRLVGHWVVEDLDENAGEWVLQQFALGGR